MTDNDHQLVLQTPYAEIEHKMNLLLDTGQLLMESGADTKRIVRDMIRAAAYMGIPWEKIRMHMTYTTIMLNIGDEDHSYTNFRKCRNHGINMSAILAVSELSWRAMEQKYVLEAYAAELAIIKGTVRHYSPLITSLGAGFACGGFCKLFGCDWIAFFLTALCACLGFWVRRICNEWGINGYASIAISAFAATFAAFFTHYLPGSSTPWHPMIACTLFIVPGIPLINSVDDLVNNYIISGSTRAINTILIVCAMTFGIVCAIRLCNVYDFTTLNIVPDSIYLSHAIAAAVAAMGFSIIFNIPPRLLPVAGVGAIISVCLRNVFSLELGMSQIAGSFIGATAVSIIGLKAAGWLRAPLHVIAIPSVIPMIPGVLMYRLLFAVINIATLDLTGLLIAIQNGIQAALIIIGIALGATIPDLIVHKYVEKGKQQHLKELLSKRAGNGYGYDTEADLDRATTIK